MESSGTGFWSAGSTGRPQYWWPPQLEEVPVGELSSEAEIFVIAFNLRLIVPRERLMRALFAGAMFPVLVTVYSVSAKAEEYKLGCVCILATSLCNFARFDEAAGKPRHEWSQPIFSASGRPSDETMALACWRKRDVGGQGFCCSMRNNESDATRYFKGHVED